MNLIDCYITEVLDRREFNSTKEWDLKDSDKLYNIDFVEYTVKYAAEGRESETWLLFKKGEEPKIEMGYWFLG